MNTGPRLILGIETSCDETAAAVLLEGRGLLSNIISSQVDIHAEYGGIVPEIASRKHVEAIDFVVKRALGEARITLNEIDALSVTQGPGLVGSLVVGLSYAKACAFSSGKPITGVNHIHAHLMACFLEKETTPRFPFVGLVVSGGHTSLYRVDHYLKVELLGSTRDDAAGEAFDKVAKILGLPYPGGPVISRLAEKGRGDAFSFPRARLPETPFDFSFSGLKTSVLQTVRRLESQGKKVVVEDICASFQEAVVDVLTEKTIHAAMEHKVGWVVAAGGVASNKRLRNRLKKACQENGLNFVVPSPVFCTDNAAMVALTGLYQIKGGITLGPDADVYSRLPVKFLNDETDGKKAP